MDKESSGFTPELTVAVIGLGLIGGSYAKGLRKLGVKKIIAIDPDEKALSQALAEKVIDQGAMKGGSLLREADLVIFCTAAQVMLAFLRDNASFFKKGALLTDVAGIKGRTAEIITQLLPKDIDFVPGHPMAGREGRGYGMSTADIFQAANYILVPRPENTPAHLQLVASLARALGCSHVVSVSAAEHDKLIAYTSSLPHVLATTLVNSESMNDKTKFFVAGSFRDGTRVANINAPLWSQLFLANKENLLLEIARFTASLRQFSQLLEAEDVAGMTAFLAQAAQRRKELVTP